ncbi:murein biosynthesis integral membrane protein MurJ [Actinomadura fulvescens]|uniref:Probable lipid II flippase MurJ n=1 Tax=Actinomadura fulvescens TaxID=46160 RepID=A0ABP6DBT5_9ACTN
MPEQQPRLLQAGRTMAVATAISRLTGFVRTLVLAAALGLGTGLLDVYTAANVTPNTIYEVVFGGALASVLVPLLVRATDDDDIDGDLFAQRLLSLVVYCLGAVVMVTVIAAPFIVDLYAPGFSLEQRQLAIMFTRYFMPQILFYAVSAVLTAVLNARGRFASPPWAPVANNVVVIATAAAFMLVGGTGKLESLTQSQTLILSIGTTTGVAAQMFVLILTSRRAGFRLRLRVNPRGIGIRRIAALAGWTIVSVAAAQAVFVVITRIASQSGSGAIGIYSHAYTLFQMPYAVIAITVMTGVLPRMSRAAANRDLAQITADLSQSLRLTSVVLVPVSAALIVLGPNLTTLLFAHGNASSAAAHLTGKVLAAFGLALVPFAAHQIMLRAFYALGDTRTPSLLSFTVSAITIVTCLAAGRITSGPNLIIALAACSAMAYAIGLLVTAQLLRRRLGRVDGRRLLGAHSRMVVAAAVAGLATALTTRAVNTTAVTGWTGTLVSVGAATMVGAGVYALTAKALHVTELKTLTAAFRSSKT